MKFQKEDFQKMKPYFWALSYAFILLVLFSLLPGFWATISKFLRLFKPLYYAIGIAFVLNIPMRNIEKMLKKVFTEGKFFYNKIRGISILLTIIFAFTVLFILLAIITPQILFSIQLLLNNAGNYILSIITNLNSMLEYFNLDPIGIQLDQEFINATLKSLGLQWEQIIQNASLWAIGTGTNLVNNALSFTSNLMTWFTGFMLSLYLLSNKETFIRQLRKAVVAIFGYRASTLILRWGKESNRIFNSFISGQLLEACILGTIYFVVLSLLNFPFAMLISSIIAITSIVPMFGAMFGMMFGCLLILAVRPFLDMILFIFIFQLVQTFEGNLIYPRVVGNSVGLPGIWVLLSIIVFGGLWGLFGMLIAVPFSAIIYNILREITNFILKKRRILVSYKDIQKL